MTTPHKATPSQWADAGAFASDTRACLLELRDRIAALEAAATPPPAPAGGLMERLAVIWSKGQPLHPVACRDAIRVIADWLQQRSDTIANGSQWAEMLRGEAE